MSDINQQIPARTAAVYSAKSIAVNAQLITFRTIQKHALINNRRKSITFIENKRQPLLILCLTIVTCNESNNCVTNRMTIKHA